MVSVAKPSRTPPVYAAWENNTVSPPFTGLVSAQAGAALQRLQNSTWYKDPGLRKNSLFIFFLYLGT